MEEHGTAGTALGLASYGGPEVLEVFERPTPDPAPGETVVRVVACTVNPTDTLLRAGKQAAHMTDLEPPYVPGMEFAGYVEASSGDAFRVGQPVAGIVNPRRPAGGAYAQFVVVPTASLVAVPNDVDLREAATIPMNGLTAKVALELADLPAGATVMITGGPGAVGGYAIQLAAAQGLHVVTDGREDDRELLLGMGAEHVVRRGAGMADEVRALVPSGVDALIDTALIGEEAESLVVDGGASVALRGVQAGDGDRLRRHGVSVTNHVLDTEALEWLVARWSAGVLTPRVAAAFPFRDGAHAHSLVEKGGLRGRVVLLPFEQLEDTRGSVSGGNAS